MYGPWFLQGGAGTVPDSEPANANLLIRSIRSVGTSAVSCSVVGSGVGVGSGTPGTLGTVGTAGIALARFVTPAGTARPQWRSS